MSGVSAALRAAAPSVERVLELIDLQIDALLAIGPPALLYDVMEGDRGVVSNLISHLPSAIQDVTIVAVVRRSQRLTIVQLRCHTDAGPFEVSTTWDARGDGRPWVIAFEFSALGSRLMTAEFPAPSPGLAGLTWRRKRRGHRPGLRPAASTLVGRRGSGAPVHRRTTAGAAH